MAVRRGAVGAAALGGLTVTLATVAIASADRPIAASNTANPDGPAAVRAKCPKGRAPVSGGLRAGDGSLYLTSAEGIDGRRWSNSTVNVEAEGSFTTFSYCSRTGRSVKVRSTEAKIDADGQRTATATCRRDERVVSGGYALVEPSPLNGIAIQNSRADARSWSVEAGNGNHESKITLVVQANCLARSKMPKVKARSASAELVDDSLTTSTVNCRKGEYALSGGYKFDQNDGFPLVRRSTRSGTTGWRFAIDGFGSGDLTLLTYCVKK